MKKYLLIILMIATLLTGCGASGDPILDDLYTQDVYPGSASVYSIGSEELPYSEGWFDNIYIADTSYGIPAYGEIYITTPIATICTLADTYYLVAGTTTSDELQDFAASNERLTYTGEGTRVVRVVAAISVSSNVNNVVLGTKLYKNGTAHEASFIQRKISVAGDVGALAIATLVDLNTDDYVEIYISSDKPAVQITFNCMSLTVATVD